MKNLGKRAKTQVDISTAFKDVVDDFISSAETEDQLSFFIMLAVMGWNVSLHAENQRRDMIKIFIDRLDRPTFTWENDLINTEEKILDICNKKILMYPDLRRQIVSLDMEGLEEGFTYSVISKPIE